MNNRTGMWTVHLVVMVVCLPWILLRMPVVLLYRVADVGEDVLGWLYRRLQWWLLCSGIRPRTRVSVSLVLWAAALGWWLS